MGAGVVDGRLWITVALSSLSTRLMMLGVRAGEDAKGVARSGFPARGVDQTASAVGGCGLLALALGLACLDALLRASAVACVTR